MTCSQPRTVHTIGHSTRPIDFFVELLTAHRIELLIDVRRWPASKRFPQFRREALAGSLAEKRIEYAWRGELGGYRTPAPDSPNTAWRTAAFRAYADFMMSGEFDASIKDLERSAAERRMALMCAEAVPWRCHRQLLADAFVVRGWAVRHILEDRCDEHKLPPFAQPNGAKIFYPAPLA